MLQVVAQLPRLYFTTFRQVNVVESLLEGAPLVLNFIDHLSLYFLARLHLQMLEVQLMPFVVAFKIVLELRVKAGVMTKV